MALIVVMGIPGAGKTTLTKKLQRSLGADAVTVSFDDLFGYSAASGSCVYPSMLSLYGFEAYSSCAHTERKACEAILRSALKTVRSTGRLMIPPYESVLWDPPPSYVIVDDIFYLRSMRRPLERIARANGFAFAVVFVDTPIENALLWNSNRQPGAIIPEATVRKIAKLIEIPPTDTNGFFRFSPNDCVDELADIIRRFRRDAKLLDVSETADAAAQSEIKCDDERWQKLEKDLRNAVGEIVKSAGTPAMARALSKAKKEVAVEMRAENARTWTHTELVERLTLRVTPRHQTGPDGLGDTEKRSFS